MPPSRVAAADRVSEQHRAAGVRQAARVAGPTSFPAVLSNAAVASERVPARAAEADAAVQSFSLATDQGARGTASGAKLPQADAAQIPDPVLPDAADAESPTLRPSEAWLRTTGPEEPGNLRAAAASEPIAPPPGSAHPACRSAAGSSVAAGGGSRNPWAALGGPIADTWPDGPGAAKEFGGLSHWTQAGSPMATLAAAPRSHVHHAQRTEQNPVLLAAAAAPLIAGDLSPGDPAGGPAPPGVTGPGSGEASAVRAAEGWDRQGSGGGTATMAGHGPDGATPKSVDPARSRAIAEKPADNSPSILPDPASSTLPDVRSIGSGPARMDQTLVDIALAAPRKAMSGDGLAAAGLQIPSDGGDGAARRVSPAAAMAGALAASPALAAAAPGNSSDIAAAQLSPAGIPEQLFGHLLQSMQNPDHEVVLRLHPPELGDLLVRVAVSGREVSAWFASPQPQVQEAISQAIGQLHTDLGNAGYNLAGAWVGADASDPRGRNARLPAPQPRDGPARGERITATAASTAATAGSGVSVYV